MDDIEGWLKGWDYEVTLKGRTLQDEAHEGSTFGLAPAPIERLGVPCDLQEQDPLLDVVLVCLLVALDSSADLGLLLAPLGDVSAVEGFLHGDFTNCQSYCLTHPKRASSSWTEASAIAHMLQVSLSFAWQPPGAPCAQGGSAEEPHHWETPGVY